MKSQEDGRKEGYTLGIGIVSSRKVKRWCCCMRKEVQGIFADRVDYLLADRNKFAATKLMATLSGVYKINPHPIYLWCIMLSSSRFVIWY